MKHYLVIVGQTVMYKFATKDYACRESTIAASKYPSASVVVAEVIGHVNHEYKYMAERIDLLRHRNR